MKVTKKIVGIALSLMLIIGSVLPNVQAEAQDMGAFDDSIIEGIRASFAGKFLEGETQWLTEYHPTGEITYEGYDIYMLEPTVTVTYNNGDAPETYRGWGQIHSDMWNKFGQVPTFRTAQNTTPFTVGSNNPVEVYFMDNDKFHCTAYVTVEENPVQSIKAVATKKIYEGSNQYFTQEWVGDGPVEYECYDIDAANPEITVVLKDQTEHTYQYTWQLYEDYGYSPYFTSDQSSTNKWGIGKHTATLNFMGKTCDFEVQIIENPVESIKANYLGVFVEGMEATPDESKVEYVFTFKDGTTEKFYKNEQVMGDWISPALEPQDVLEDGTWNAGKHYWTGTLCGKEFSVEVDVLSKANTPIKSISAVAGGDLMLDVHVGTYDEENFYLIPEYCNPKVTLTYQDGSKETVPYQALKSKFKGVEPSLTLDNPSVEGAGKRTATLEFYGCSCPLEINVIENPIESISAVSTKPLVQGWRDVYSLVYDGGLVITVNYKDGKKVSGSANELMPIFYDFPWDDIEEDLSVGKHVTKLYYLEKTCDVEFEIVADPNPVIGIDAKVKNDAVLYQNLGTKGDVRYHYEHLIDVTLRFKDGSSISGTIEEVNKQLDHINIREVMTEDSQGIKEWGVGKHSVTVSYMDLEKEVEVQVVENPYASAHISNDDGLTVVLDRKNGEKEVYKATEFYTVGTSGSNWSMMGYLSTDRGTLPVAVKYAGGQNRDYTNISQMIIHGIKSNSLQNCEWMEQQLITEMNGNVPKVVVNNSADELKELVLTDADYLMGSEEDVKAWLEVSEKTTVTSEEQKLLDQAKGSLGNYKDGVIIDFTLYRQSYGMMSSELITEKVPEPNGKVSITMAVPEDVLASGTDPSTIKMIRIHEGKTDVIPCTYDATTKTITFETDAFSTYSMVYQAGTAVQPSPNTGDASLAMGYTLLCVAMMAVMYVLKKRSVLEK